MNKVQNESLSYTPKKQKGKGSNPIQENIAFPDISPPPMKMKTSNTLEPDILALSKREKKKKKISNAQFPLGLLCTLCTLQPPLILVLLLLSNTIFSPLQVIHKFYWGI